MKNIEFEKIITLKTIEKEWRILNREINKGGPAEFPKTLHKQDRISKSSEELWEIPGSDGEGP